MSMQLFDVSAPTLFREVTLSGLPLSQNGSVVWLDLRNPTHDEVRAIGSAFRFHPLAIEDVQRRRQRPKVDVYDAHLFLVLYAIEIEAEESRPQFQEVSIFLTRSAVVTVHRGDVEEVDIAAQRWADHCADGMKQDAAMLVYTLADSIVDGYFPCMDDIGDYINRIEEQMFARAGTETLEEVFRLKRSLLEMRRAVAPARDVFNAFTRRELPLLGEHSFTYFQDVYDHVLRVTDSIDAFRDILSSVIDVHLTLMSNNLSQTVRTLTVVSIILMTLALIAGIYGMNFENMPELTWRYGYFTVLGLMATIGITLAAIFRKLHWW